MMPSATYLFALANLAVCAAIVGISICRLNAMWGARWMVRAEYAGYIGAAFASGLSPMYGRWPWWDSIAVAAAILLGLLASGRAWAGDRTPAVATDLAPLEHQ
ncbi:hypothetical protein [Pseudacidovorax sp. NFM-22]|uniref:hypothetical protein n=1 Tax=Pseudacidovorax sp. NFM-22 TaxID=2744469 RepID=UPI001F1B4AAA|nr:hypothetical protein [Pseudacidovorax sp. NFM-22]